MISAVARAKVRARVEAQMTAKITILRGALGTLDETTGLVGGLTSTTTIYAGKARVRDVAGEGTVAVGDGQVNQRQVTVTIPWNATVPRQDDLVVVNDDAAADPDLTGQVWRVLEVSGGTLFGDSRQLSCTGWHGNRYWRQS